MGGKECIGGKKNLVYYFTSIPSLFSSEEEAEGRASKVNGSKSCFGIETFPLLAHSLLLSSVRLSAKYEGAYLYTFKNLFKALEHQSYFYPIFGSIKVAQILFVANISAI